MRLAANSCSRCPWPRADARPRRRPRGHRVQRQCWDTSHAQRAQLEVGNIARRTLRLRAGDEDPEVKPDAVKLMTPSSASTSRIGVASRRREPLDAHDSGAAHLPGVAKPTIAAVHWMSAQWLRPQSRLRRLAREWKWRIGARLNVAVALYRRDQPEARRGRRSRVPLRMAVLERLEVQNVMEQARVAVPRLGDGRPLEPTLIRFTTAAGRVGRSSTPAERRRWQSCSATDHRRFLGLSTR